MGTHTTAKPMLSRRCLIRWTGRLLVLAMALLVAFVVTILLVLPRITNAQALTVLSGSMTPGIPVGSVVLVRPVDPQQLQVGDIATYQAEPGKAVYITHRVAAIGAADGQLRFTFKGDANRGADVKPVVPGQIRGEMWFHVPYLGTIRGRLHSSGVRILLLILIVGGYALTQLVSGFRERSESPPTTAPTPEEAHSVDA